MNIFGVDRAKDYFNTLNQKLDQIIVKQSELAGSLEKVSTQLSKAKDEIMAELDKLRSSDPDLSPEGVEAVQKLGNIAQALDDVIKDQPAPEQEGKVRDHRYEKGHGA